jgi:hypothetical protein
VAWGPSAFIGFGVSGAGLLAWAAAAAGARWSRWRARRRIGRRIAEVYETILARAEAARAADYARLPPEAFALYHALREELFELGQVGGAVQVVKDAVARASAEAPAAGAARPVKGAGGAPRQSPLHPEAAPEPLPAEALRAAVLAFCDYWRRRSRVEADLLGVLRSLGADPAPIRRSDNRSPAPSRARLRSRPGAPSGASWRYRRRTRP